MNVIIILILLDKKLFKLLYVSQIKSLIKNFSLKLQKIIIAFKIFI